MIRMTTGSGMEDIQDLNQLLGVGEAACAEEVTQQSALEGEPAYGRYGTVYAQRERERGTKNISYYKKCNNYKVRATTTY